jgi:uncharacterized RDD family membrane protein YckC
MMETGEEEVKNETQTSVRYGGFWIRGMALIIDELICILIYVAIILPLGFSGILDDANNTGMQIFAYALLLVIMVIYYTAFVAKCGATPGKMLMGLRVMRADDQSPVSVGLAFGRFWATRLSALIIFIGYLVSIGSVEKAAMHDSICGTRVINIRDPEKSRRVFLVVLLIMILAPVCTIIVARINNARFFEMSEKIDYYNRSEKVYEGFVYRKEGDGVTITGYWGESPDIVIPEKIKGKPVVVIDMPFRGQSFAPVNSISYPKTVKAIATDSLYFYGNDNYAAITSFIVDSENEAYCSIDGVLFNKERTHLLHYPPMKPVNTYEIPSGVTTVSNGAFYGAKQLKVVEVPDTVTVLGVGAFSSCSSLEAISIPVNVTEIDEGTFSDCENLRIVVIPPSVKSIGARAFMYCPVLTQITIGKDVNIARDNFTGGEFSQKFVDFYEDWQRNAGVYTYSRNRWNYSSGKK